MSWIKKINDVEDILDDMEGFIGEVIAATKNDSIKWKEDELSALLVSRKLGWKRGEREITKISSAPMSKRNKRLVVMEYTYYGDAPWEATMEANLFWTSGDDVYMIYNHEEGCYEEKDYEIRKLANCLLDEIRDWFQWQHSRENAKLESVTEELPIN